MKVGSLVVCVKSSSSSRFHKTTYLDKIYTIREIQITKGLDGFGLLFEEIVNPIYHHTGQEFDYDPERFRELDTPQSISIEEILEETVYA